ncbi:M20 family metallopeptidase [Salinibaculum rarum]|uniref:M20 family metallopeptidase n=1 Tax=Salinibaculum rarum TaxID=3058903 RepID=UPI00265EE4AF|nr:M20 family metallopeptidase [Salinibaculum sp. KK48]
MTIDVHEFHREAVETPSHEDVTAMRELLVETLESGGVEPTVDDIGNVTATRGAGSPHIVLNTHIDTVPPHVEYERDGDIVRGRGACDAKGPLAALLAAFFDATVSDGRLTLAISPNEETVQTGGAHLAETLDADGVIVGEPTDLDVCTAARGQFEGEITIRGESAHAADPASGQNAIRAATVIVQGMETYDEKYGPGEHDSLGRPTLTPTLIEGGEATNQVPGECTITFDRRSVPPESVDAFVAQLEEHLYQLLPRGMDLSVSLARPEMPYPEAFATDEDDPLVETLQQASGGDVRPFGAATEASYFAASAPTVVFGPGVLADDEGPVAHADREYVDRRDVAAAARAVTDAVSDLLG